MDPADRPPEVWPERPAFGTFRVVTEEKRDGRRVHYYDWPDEGDMPAPGAGVGAVTDDDDV